MCGIAGILYRDSGRPVERGALKGMADAIAHRGPDAEGYWIGNGQGVGLAHRRLSIIDLAGGQQPLGNEDGSVQVVFNGEIYNYRELREGLVARGHTLRTSSDTEVLVHLYEERGPALVEKLRGMFAFALWDCRQRRLVLARDRVGIKPLYVYRDGEKLLFGSELKAILAHPQVERQVDAEALEDYLALGCVPGKRSIFKRIEKLPAAHVLVVSAERWEATAERYWELRFEPDEQRSEGEWREAISAKVAETVERYMIADVPVGAFLSGGLDSSVVVGEATGGHREQGTGHRQVEPQRHGGTEIGNREEGTGHRDDTTAPKVRDSIAQGETLGNDATINEKPQRGAIPPGDNDRHVSTEANEAIEGQNSHESGYDANGTARSRFPTEAIDNPKSNPGAPGQNAKSKEGTGDREQRTGDRDDGGTDVNPKSKIQNPKFRSLATSHQPLATFSMGFHEAGFSELPFARQVAERFGTRHTEEIVTPDAAGLVEELSFYFDEPFADSSAVPTYLVSKLARRHVKVVLSGDGGDEAFGGYARYAHDLDEAAARAMLPGWLRRGAIGPLASLWPKADWLPRPLRAKTRLTNLALEADAAYANTLMLCRLPERRRLLSAGMAAELNGHRPESLIREAFGRSGKGDRNLLCEAPSGPFRQKVPVPFSQDVLAGMLAADTAVLLPDDFLTKVDRASMACGLEVRPPLVDHELLELAATVPSRLKVRGGETKWIMKRAFADRLPHDAVWRAKHGFEIPVDAWLRGPLKEMFQDSVLAPGARVAELVDQRAVGRLYRAHLAKVGRHGGVLWSMLMLAKWAERWSTEGA